MGATGSRLRVPEESCPSRVGMLAGTHTRLNGFCCFDRGWPACHPRVGIKLPLSGTVCKTSRSNQFCGRFPRQTELSYNYQPHHNQ